GFFGPSPFGGDDVLNVLGSVALNNPQLSAGFGYPPREGDVITLIQKGTTGAVSGIFSGLPEGSVTTLGDIPVVVSYLGGDGNEVTMTVTNLPLRSGGAQLVTGNGGSAFVPNDCSSLLLVVTNGSAITLSSLHGSLRAVTPGVLVTKGESD